MKPKVLILTAGKGSRLEERTKYFNKALLRVGNKAVISHTIEQFDINMEFIIALGYKGDIVKQYLEIAHPNNKFTFIEIDKYSEPGAGPGYAALMCKHHLQCPFYFFSCDAIVDQIGYFSVGNGKFWDNIPKEFLEDENCDIDYNSHNIFDLKDDWTAFDFIEKNDSQKYCTIDVKNNRVKKFFDKQINSSNKAFVGVAFVKNYKEFWFKLEKEKFTINNEMQIAPVILSLDSIKAIKVKWFDTGSEEGLQKARQHFKGLQNLDKLDEELYIVNGSVIKYFHSENMAKSRIARAENLKDSIPTIIAKSKNFYKYDFVEGSDLFKIDSQNEIMEDLLDFTNNTLWCDVTSLSSTEKMLFKDVCKKFYFEKTQSRLNKLYSKINITEEDNIINGDNVSSLKKMFNVLNWDYIADGHPSNFHGDTYFGNILLTKDRSFKFIDWRQDFGGILEYGDRYYDMSKLYNSFLFPYPSIRDNKFYIEESGNKVKTFIEIPVNIEKSKDVFEAWVQNKGYDLWKIRILTGIILLNMSPLHERPLDKFLYYYGKHYLYKTISENM